MIDEDSEDKEHTPYAPIHPPEAWKLTKGQLDCEEKVLSDSVNNICLEPTLVGNQNFCINQTPFTEADFNAFLISPPPNDNVPEPKTTQYEYVNTPPPFENFYEPSDPADFPLEIETSLGLC